MLVELLGFFGHSFSRYSIKFLIMIWRSYIAHTAFFTRRNVQKSLLIYGVGQDVVTVASAHKGGAFGVIREVQMLVLLLETESVYLDIHFTVSMNDVFLLELVCIGWTLFFGDVHLSLVVKLGSCN